MESREEDTLLKMIAEKEKGLRNIENLKHHLQRLEAEERIFQIQISILDEAFTMVEGMTNLGSGFPDINDFRQAAKPELIVIAEEYAENYLVEQEQNSVNLRLLEEMSELLDLQTTMLGDQEKILLQHSEFIDKVSSTLENPPSLQKKPGLNLLPKSELRTSNISSKVANFISSTKSPPLPSSSNLFFIHPKDITGRSLNKPSNISESRHSNLSPIFHKPKAAGLEYFETLFATRIKGSHLESLHRLKRNLDGLHSVQGFPNKVGLGRRSNNNRSLHTTRQGLNFIMRDGSQGSSRRKINMSVDLLRKKIDARRGKINDSSLNGLSDSGGLPSKNNSPDVSIIKPAGSKIAGLKNHPGLPDKKKERLSLKVESKLEPIMKVQLEPQNHRNKANAENKIPLLNLENNLDSSPANIKPPQKDLTDDLDSKSDDESVVEESETSELSTYRKSLENAETEK